MRTIHVRAHDRHIPGKSRTIPTNRATVDLSKPFFTDPIYPTLTSRLRGLLRTLTSQNEKKGG